VLVFNRADPDENGRADRCYRRLAREFANRGIGVGRSPIDYQADHMDMLVSSFKTTTQAIKAALDPNGIIAPGRYGIG
jgi:4-cresol dehydrogenase (hydroxylating)